MLFFFQWFQDYPEYQANPFFISGESYGGIYVPTLSRNVANGISGPCHAPFMDFPFNLLLPRYWYLLLQNTAMSQLIEFEVSENICT